MFDRFVYNIGHSITNKILSGMTLEDIILMGIEKAENDNKKSAVKTLKELIKGGKK